MLVQIPLNEINNDGKDSGITIDPMNCNDNLLRCYGDEVILRIINENIGVQISLADIILTCSSEDDYESQISYFYPVEGEKKSNSVVMAIFRAVHKVYDKSGRIIAYEVYSPTSQACKLFKNAYDRKMLDKWIYVFYSKGIAEDCTDIGLFRYNPKNKSRLRIAMMKNERFFRYILNAGDYGVTLPGLQISQYNLSEIDQVPFIDEVASIANNLYVIVFRKEKANGSYYYGKMLTWD